MAWTDDESTEQQHKLCKILKYNNPSDTFTARETVR